MGIKSITTYLNERNIRTRDGGHWGIASVHQILTRTTYIGQQLLAFAVLYRNGAP